MIRVEKRLRDILYRLECPSQMDLGEYQLGLMDLFQKNEVAAHLQSCPRCKQDLVALRGYMALPMFEPASQVKEEKRSLLEEVWVFVVDLLSPPAGLETPAPLQPALRGEMDGIATRVFHIDPYIISLSAVKEPAALSKQNIIGDIIPISAEPADFNYWTVYLWRNGNLLATSPVDEDSQFSFENVQIENEYHDLIVSGPMVEIHLQNLRMS